MSITYRDKPNHTGFAKFFYDSAVEEREHAMKLIDYLNSRGGEVALTAIMVISCSKARSHTYMYVVYEMYT